MAAPDRTPRPVSADPGDVSVFFENGATVILLRGNIDLSVADDLEHAGRDAIDAELPVHTDVRAVDSIDSVGISFLIRLAGNARAAGTGVSLVGPAPRVSELLTLLEADDLFQWIDPTDSP
ncbi:MAG: STAS domain-containing protein [Kineosporiaceae bacterium]